MKHVKDRLTGLMVILAMGLPIVVLTTRFITVVEQYDRNMAIVLSGWPELEFWLLQAIRLLGLFLILSGLIMLFSPGTVD